MPTLLVVEDPNTWRLPIDGVSIVSAKSYIEAAEHADLRRAKVFNLCRNYAYQSVGYYVSLLAEARGHKPMPSVATIQDLRTAPVIRVVSESLQTLIDSSLRRLKSDQFTLSIYWGRNLAERYDRLSQALFNHFPAPLLRAEFERHDGGIGDLQRWRLKRLSVLAWQDIPKGHEAFVVERAKRFFLRPSRSSPKRARYDIAVLINPDEQDAPSDQKALRRFSNAAAKLGAHCTFITRADYGRIAEFDALFIRETTRVNHHTYRFARRAEAEGLVVADDPESIIRCTNKVYLAELFRRHDIPAPRTQIITRKNALEQTEKLGTPVVLKQPDSSFSKGVTKVETREELAKRLDELFAESELLVAQEFVPSEFDWRIGILGGKLLFACKYYMARGHWQIQVSAGNRRRYGKHETCELENVPEAARRLALRACSLIGDGFYGVDIKQLGDRFYVIEINDNPNVEAGCEDAVNRDELYHRLAWHFVDRIERRTTRRNSPQLEQAQQDIKHNQENDIPLHSQ